MLLLRVSTYRSPCGYRWRALIHRVQGKRASFSPSSSALLYSVWDMILAVEGSYQHCVPLRFLLCRERKSQLRSLLRKERNILLRSWSGPGDQACSKAIQLTVCTLNHVPRTRNNELPYHSSIFYKLYFVSSRQFFIKIGKYPLKCKKCEMTHFWTTKSLKGGHFSIIKDFEDLYFD